MTQTSDVVELYSLNQAWYVRTTERNVIRYKTFGSERSARSYASEAAERLRVQVDQLTDE